VRLRASRLVQLAHSAAALGMTFKQRPVKAPLSSAVTRSCCNSSSTHRTWPVGVKVQVDHRIIQVCESHILRIACEGGLHVDTGHKGR